MGIETFERCDRCGHRQLKGAPAARGMHRVAVVIDDYHGGCPPALWCAPCLAAVGIAAAPERPDKYTPPDTLDDIIREIIREEIDEAVNDAVDVATGCLDDRVAEAVADAKED